MEQTNLFKTWCIRIVLIIPLISITPLSVLASYKASFELATEAKCIFLNGNWVVVDRTLSQAPTAYVDTNTLFVENIVVGKDIAISIIDSYGQKVYEDIIIKFSSSSVVIMLDAFPEGAYTLQLTNSLGGYLSGNFIIY